jgi:hypothetical protein
MRAIPFLLQTKAMIPQSDYADSARATAAAVHLPLASLWLWMEAVLRDCEVRARRTAVSDWRRRGRPLADAHEERAAQQER